MNQKIYSEGWERKLLEQFTEKNRNRMKAYICSPLRADTAKDLLMNIERARAYMLYAYEKMGLVARAPHAYLPMLLDDGIPAERAIALQFGQRLLENSDVLLVCGNTLSHGMRSEINYALSLGIPVIAFNQDLYIDLKQLADKEHPAMSKKVILQQEHFTMGFTNPVVFVNAMEEKP